MAFRLPQLPGLYLRWYQDEARDSIWQYFADGGEGNPVCALPTGTGKSVVIASFVKEVLGAYPDQRIIKLTHRKELIEQNAKKLLELWPLAPVGVYSAGLGRREFRHPVTFAGIASVAKKADVFGKIDLVLIDECHLLGPKDGTQYRQFIGDLKTVNPSLKVIGFTATPYRLGQGRLTDPGGIFTDLCYDLTTYDGFNRLIAEGFLCPLTPKQTDKELDVRGVGIHGGEYIQSELQAAVDKDEITRAALKEMVEKAYDRKHWLIFAAGVEHSNHIATILNDYFGVRTVAIHSRMEGDRDQAIRDWKAGKYRCAVNNDILTTGIDFPGIDAIGYLRPTQSPALWVQSLGRGTRPYENKKNCLVLDFAGNTRRLGPINDPVLPRPKGQKGKGDAPVKICPVCATYNHTRATHCCNCGHEFTAEVKIKETASELELMAGEGPMVETFAVKHVTYARHVPRDNRPPSMRVTYHCDGMRKFTEYVALEHHSGLVRHKARDWWRERTGEEPPETVDEALSRGETELATPTHVQVWVNKEYPEVLAYCYDGTGFGTDKAN